jgi:hypothetical protein
MGAKHALVGTVARGPIALLMRAVAPGAVFAPMPGLNPELRPQAIGDLAESGFFHLLDVSSGIDAGYLTTVMAVQSCTEGLVGEELSHRTAR